MALTIEQKLAALLSEQQQIAKNYQEAETVVKNCEIKLKFHDSKSFSRFDNRKDASGCERVENGS